MKYILVGWKIIKTQLKSCDLLQVPNCKQANKTEINPNNTKVNSKLQRYKKFQVQTITQAQTQISQSISHTYICLYIHIHIYVYIQIQIIKQMRQRTSPIAILLIIMFANMNIKISKAQVLAINNSNRRQKMQSFQFQHEMPTSLVVGEYFRIVGQITDEEFYNFTNNTGNQTYFYIIQLLFIHQQQNGIICSLDFPTTNQTFLIICSIPHINIYTLKITATLLDQSGSIVENSKNISETFKYKVSVISSPKQPILTSTSNRTPPPKPEGLHISYAKGNLFVKWASQAALTNVTFYQKKGDTVTARKTFLVSSYLQEVSPMLFEFMEFEVGETLVEISHANSESGFFDKVSSKFGEEKSVVKFRALFHILPIGSRQIFTQYPPLPSHLQPKQIQKHTLSFKIRCTNFYIVKYLHPSNKYIKTIYINKNRTLIDVQDNSIKQNTPITLSLMFQDPGTYILQFYTHTKKIILRHVVFIGDGLPLVPDYQDLAPYFQYSNAQEIIRAIQKYLIKTVTKQFIQEPLQDSSLTAQRNYLFMLINAERKGYRVKPLAFDEKLNELAQNHSEDMKTNRFLSIYSSRKESIFQRALRANVTTFIRFFIMDSQTLSQNFISTQRHLGMNQQQINPKMTRIGIGVVKLDISNKTRYLVSYCLSIRDLVADPPPLQQLENFKNDLIAAVLERNPNIRQQDKQLSADMAAWVKQNKSNDAEELEDYLATGKYGKSLRVEKKMVTFYEQEVGYLKDEGALDNKKGSKVGLALSIDRDSISSLTAFFAYI